MPHPTPFLNKMKRSLVHCEDLSDCSKKLHLQSLQQIRSFRIIYRSEPRGNTESPAQEEEEEQREDQVKSGKKLTKNSSFTVFKFRTFAHKHDSDLMTGQISWLLCGSLSSDRLRTQTRSSVD